jgi:signal transduction histidine kinase
MVRVLVVDDEEPIRTCGRRPVMAALLSFVEFGPLKHRPPLPRRWQLYCVVAYLAPPIMLQLVSADAVPYRDLVWLITLVPAFLLSLQYGMRGATAGLLMGTVLFTAIQLLGAWHLDPEDWRVTVPIYIAYGAIAISVGWLSDRLHGFYDRAIQGERLAAISQVAVTIRHEVNNALSALLAEAGLVQLTGRVPHPEDQESLQKIKESAARIRDSVERLTRVTDAPTIDYLPGLPMIDLGGIRVGRAPSRDPFSGPM